MSVETLVQAYLKLSEADKMRFITLLEAEGLSSAWKTEIDRRWNAFKKGKTKPLDGYEVEQQLTKKHDL